MADQINSRHWHVQIYATLELVSSPVVADRAVPRTPFLGLLDNSSGEEYTKSIQRTLVALSRGARAPTNPMKGPAMREFGKDFPRAFEAPDCWIIRQHRHFSRELTLRHSSHDQPHGVRHGTQFPLIPASIRHTGHFGHWPGVDNFAKGRSAR